jgi:peptide deformylase
MFKSKLKIVTYGNPVLRQPTKPITKIDNGIKKLAEQMIQTMHAAEGIGLAAPQIGKSLALFVVDTSAVEEEASPMAFLNIEILESSGSIAYNEGCLSIPGVTAEVDRPDKIKIRYLDLHGKRHEGMAEGILARVIQHETDHLKGKLFIDYLDEKTLQSFQPLLEAMEAKNKKLTKGKLIKK